MERETRTIKLSELEIDIYTSLTWGDNERIKSELTKGAEVNNIKDGNPENISFNFRPEVMLEGKYVLLEIAIKEIRRGEEKIKFDREIINALSIEDGDKLYSEVETLKKK